MIVRFGILCDVCGAGSVDYACDCTTCDQCERDLCEGCEKATGHRKTRDADVDQSRTITCEVVS